MVNHKNISLIKSGVRIIGFLFILARDFTNGAVILMVAEVFGIIEENYEIGD